MKLFDKLFTFFLKMKMKRELKIFAKKAKRGVKKWLISI